MDIDIIQKARLYSEAVKRHDILIEKKKTLNGRKKNWLKFRITI